MLPSSVIGYQLLELLFILLEHPFPASKLLIVLAPLYEVRIRLSQLLLVQSFQEAFRCNPVPLFPFLNRAFEPPDKLSAQTDLSSDGYFIFICVHSGHCSCFMGPFLIKLSPRLGIREDCLLEQRAKARSKTCYYKILGVSVQATPEDIRSAFRYLAMKLHPDRNPGNPMAAERFREV